MRRESAAGVAADFRLEPGHLARLGRKRERLAPRGASLLRFAAPLKEVAQVLMDRRRTRVAARGVTQIALGFVELPHFEIDPAEAVEERGVGRLGARGAHDL